MALPSLAFLLKSERAWKAKHTYRQARARVWQRRESHRYHTWRRYADALPKGNSHREKWWDLYQEASAQVDKWEGLRDEASYWLRRRRGELAEKRSALTPHFDVSEFDCHDGRKVPEEAVPALRRLCEDVLEPLCEKFGDARVSSGYRPADYNRRIGGASQSQHIYDLGPESVAADVSFARGAPAQWAAAARSLRKGGVGEYRRAGFLHVDNGPVRTWTG